MIREIRQSELAVLLDLYSHMHKEDAPATAEALEDVWVKIVTDQNIHYFGLFEESRLIACCHLVIVPNLTRGAKPYGLIENVVTRMEFRREGYGKAVLRHALKFAWDYQCYKVMLMTGRKDESVYRFYESAGFDRYGKQAFIIKPA